LTGSKNKSNDSVSSRLSGFYEGFNERFANLEDKVKELEEKVSSLSSKKQTGDGTRASAAKQPVKLTECQMSCISNLVRDKIMGSIKFLTPAVLLSQGQKIQDECIKVAEISPELASNHNLTTQIHSIAKRVLSVSKGHLKRNMKDAAIGKYSKK
jgi:polyhydroxyalkanoate synthesis regulator phasin